MSISPQLTGRVSSAGEAVEIFPSHVDERDFSFMSYRTEAQVSRGAA